MKPIFEKIPPINITDCSFKNRVLSFDPSEVYARIEVDAFKRHQYIKIEDAFPKLVISKCACGCLNDNSYSFWWYSNECRQFAEYVCGIISGYSDHVRSILLLKYNKWDCINCGSTVDIHTEHIIPIHKGGGGCWLNNFQPLCKMCHIEKTLSERF